jgi:hypothetical protein
MESLRLLITDNSLLLTQKGETLLQKTFSSDEECFLFITPALAAFKKRSLECFFSGSRLVSETRIVRFVDKEPFVVDKAMIDRLIQNGSHSFIEEHKEKQVDIVTTSIKNISLNGYSVKAFKKEKVSEMQVIVFFAAIPSSYKSALLRALQPIKENRITFGSFAESLINRIYEHSKQEEFITCSTYERSSDISIRKCNNFFETYTIPLGTHQVLEHITRGLSLTLEEAEQQLSLYNEGRLDPVLEAKMDAAILSFQITLDKEVKKALNVLSEGISLPSSVYLLVAPYFRKAYDNAFKSDSYHSLSFSEKGFEVTNMSSILTS